MHRPLESWPRVGAGLSLSLALICASPLAWAQDQHLGRNLAATCANCHGTNGQAAGEAKVLAGLTEEALFGMLAAYKSGGLNGTIMQQIAKGYTDEQLRLVAAYLATQKSPK